MKTYQITSSLSIEGPTLKDAIENNFTRIAESLRIGNAAGYQLHQVWCEYDKKMQAAVLHVIASGSDLFVQYDPAKDAPAERTLVIPATPEDCPQRIDFELAEDKTAPFDPFDDTCLNTPSARYGALLGIIDEIGQNHCKIKDMDPVTGKVSCHFPTLRLTYPLRYAEACRKELARRRPKTDNETTRLMERVSDLMSMVLGSPNDRLKDGMFAEAKTAIYFRSIGKITALAKIRNEKKMTQKQLAEASQMSVRQLQNYEKCPGSTLWSASRSVPARLANALGVKQSDIIDDYGHPILVDK